MNQSRSIGRLLVTGAGGFVGRHIAAMAESGTLPSSSLLVPPKGWDIRDEEAVAKWVQEANPDSVIHLAAQSFVPRAFENPKETLEINVIGTLNLLQALKQAEFRGRLIYVSSGDVYGQVPESLLPLDETRFPEPRNPYAVSKLAAEQLCLQWHRSDQLDVLVARPFNHVGPGQGRQFVLPAMARQIVAMAEGRQPMVLNVGDIDTSRDFTDVRDVVSAYIALLQKGVAGNIYVIGSGEERRIRDLIQEMCRLSGISPEIRQESARMRPADQRRMVANAGRLRRDTGWAPSFSIETTLTDILEDARNNP